MTAQLIRAPGLYQDAPYAYASIARPGAVIFTAGACPLDTAGLVVGGENVAAQARQAMTNLAAALAAAGAGLTDVLKTTVFVVSDDRADLVEVWDVVRAAFGDHDAPSTLLGIAALGYDGQRVEIEAIAVAGGAGTASRPGQA